MNTSLLDQSNAHALPPPCRSPGVLVDEDWAISHFSASRPHQKFKQAPAAGLQRHESGWRVPVDAGVCLTESLRSRWQTCDKQLLECRKKLSEQSVHQLRVATRRLMTQFVLLSYAVPGVKVEKARRFLKRQLKLLGEIRDIQVQRMFIEKQIPRFPRLRSVRNFLQGRERHLVTSIGRKVIRFKRRRLKKWTLSLCRDLESNCRNPAETDRMATEVFCATADAFAEVVRCCEAIDPADSESIHRTRVAFKKFRYMIESLSPSFTGLNKRQLRQLGNYQRRMGSLQDLEILQTSIASFGRQHEDAEALAPFYRYLRQRHARVLRSCLKNADGLFDFWPLTGLNRFERKP